MAKWQNLELSIFDGVGQYKIPEIAPVYELPHVNKYIQSAYVKRYRSDRYDRRTTAVHFYEFDEKFECCWTYPDRYAHALSEFAFIIGPDFSIYSDFPLAVRIYNHYRNMWLVKYWQMRYNMIIVPTVLWGYEDTWDWCFDGLPKNSIVSVSNIGNTKSNEDKEFFLNGYNEMLRRLNPSKVLVFTRNFPELDGNVEYVRWELHKGDQLNGNWKT